MTESKWAAAENEMARRVERRFKAMLANDDLQSWPAAPAEIAESIEQSLTQEQRRLLCQGIALRMFMSLAEDFVDQASGGRNVKIVVVGPDGHAIQLT